MLSGLGVGAVTATATAWLSELDGAARRRAQIVATGANLGGLGLGALVSGALAQWAGHALLVPFVVFIAALLLACIAVLAAPETRRTGPITASRPLCAQTSSLQTGGFGAEPPTPTAPINCLLTTMGRPPEFGNKPR